ncbi:PST-A protein [Plasmodium ovale wallikeri]|uniref:PST-A protein n=2 Tax=Plasmodium ovale TaxID=36330 RepID=A0A1A9AN33_PLAOA|nr:PST-A protein [Plasmodium ovale wallikeri]SBT57614.1 PST-A protein [Plasmodium ovale wallikeri]SBT75765.1 lysophospholipase, putative [Plasmodium ovale]
MVENALCTIGSNAITTHNPTLDGRPTLGSFYNKDGLLLRTYGWLVKKAIGIIILIHGLNSHVRYSFLRHNVHIVNNNRAILKDGNNYYIYKDSWVEHLNKRGFSVYGIDLQGHGESEGWENLSLNVKEYDDLVYDVLQFIGKVQDTHSLTDNNDSLLPYNRNMPRRRISPPIYIIGQSMGGNVALRALQLLGKYRHYYGDLNIKGCVSLSGMISIGALGLPTSFRYNCFFVPLSRFFSDFLPTLRLLCELPYKRFQYVRDLGRYDRIRYRNGITCRFAYELIRAMLNLENDMKYIPRDIPILFIHSKKDKLCYCKGVVSFYNRLNNYNKELHVLEYMEHMLTLEPGNNYVLSKIIKWIESISAPKLTNS